eukprot:4841741-Ditylum_brightwellii.AAC.1
MDEDKEYNDKRMSSTTRTRSAMKRRMVPTTRARVTKAMTAATMMTMKMSTTVMIISFMSR